MHAHTDSLDDMMRTTVEAAIDLANSLDGGADVVRALLVEHQFSDAAEADAEAIDALVVRFGHLGQLIESLPDAPLEEAVHALNAELARSSVAPTLSAHDGAALHLHWTSMQVPFADRVAVDIVMALAQAICDWGTDRFGRCGAEGCERVFFDATKNGSRRFCSDSRCATRTHTAAHRARKGK